VYVRKESLEVTDFIRSVSALETALPEGVLEGDWEIDDDEEVGSVCSEDGKSGEDGEAGDTPSGMTEAEGGLDMGGLDMDGTCDSERLVAVELLNVFEYLKEHEKKGVKVQAALWSWALGVQLASSYTAPLASTTQTSASAAAGR
jgi:hypothetical protein